LLLLGSAAVFALYGVGVGLAVCIGFAILNDLAGAVHRALEPAHVSVWISQQAEDRRLPGPASSGCR
jgi:hypothetical protein